MVFVGFSTPRRWNPLSALIRAMMSSRTSHAWLLVEDPIFDLRLVLEAHSTGFRLVSFANFVRDNKVVAIVAPAHSLEAGLPAAGGWLGGEFDLLGLFGIFLTLVARWFRRRRWRNPFTSSRALFCSEAVVRVLKAAHHPGAGRFGTETTTPQQLLAFFEREAGAQVTYGEQLNLWTHLRRTGRRRRAIAAAATGPAPVP